MKKLESVEQFDAIKSEGKSVFMFSLIGVATANSSNQ